MDVPKYLKDYIDGIKSVRPGLSILTVYHDDWCAYFKGQPCNCTPTTSSKAWKDIKQPKKN